MLETKEPLIVRKASGSAFSSQFSRYRRWVTRFVVRNAEKEIRIVGALAFHAALTAAQGWLDTKHAFWVSAVTVGVGIYALIEFCILAGFELALLVARKRSAYMREQMRDRR